MTSAGEEDFPRNPIRDLNFVSQEDDLVRAEQPSDQTIRDKPRKVYLAGIFDTEAFHWGPELFKIVVDMLNDHEDGWFDDIFDDGTQIEYLIGNAACRGPEAATAYWNVREQFDGLIHGVVGCRCSSASFSVATIAGLENVPMISFASTSYKLSNADDYPLFSRVVSPDNERGEVGALVEMLRGFGWSRVSIMFTDKLYARDFSAEFQRLWNANGRDTAHQFSAVKINDDDDVDRASVEQAFAAAPKDSAQKSRIILLFGHNKHVYQILQHAQRTGFQPDAVWVGAQGWVGRLPADTRWIPPVPGYIGITPYRNKNSVYQDFLDRVAASQAAEGKTAWSEMPDYAAEYMVDSILALTKALSSAPVEQRNDGEWITRQIQQQTVDGVSGRVRFTSEGDRLDPQFTIFNLQEIEGKLTWVDTGSVSVSTADFREGTTDIVFDAVCFMGRSCGDIPSDIYPVDEEPESIWLPIALTCSVGLFCALVLLGIKQWHGKIVQQNYRQELARTAEQLEKQTQDMVEVTQDLPVQTAAEYREKIDMDKRDTELRAVSWYWAEDWDLVGRQTNVLAGTNFVGYQDEVSNQIEHAYQLYNEKQGSQYYDVDLTDKVQKLRNAQTGRHYRIDFESMQQRHTKTGKDRTIYREENEYLLSEEVAKFLPPLPDDFSAEGDREGEGLLPTITGQVIQISKIHPVDGHWAYGNVVYDPMLHDAIDKSPSEERDSGFNAVLAKALHNRPTSGWFPKNAVTKHAGVNVMQKLLGSFGGGGVATLLPPATWEMARSGRVEVRESTAEYNEVVSYFLSALYSQSSGVSVTKVERIQNLPLWQTYAVKRQTIKARDKNNPEHRVNNLDPDEIERKWLFHGTTHDNLGKIEKQGFNRAFAGKNAVVYGKGVYFARDASYSAHQKYSRADNSGTKYIFLSRVVVGDWSKGTNGQLTPDPKPHNSLELFDSTVDNVRNPSVFVVYHDSQAYPEYLVSFERS